MKRLFRVASGLFINSVIPIISLLLISLILKDGSITNVFSITYPFQFIFTIMLLFFVTSSLIRQEKENNKNTYMTGIVLGIFATLIYTIICIVLVDNYLTFLSLDIQKYKLITTYSIFQQFLNCVFSMIIEKYYFEDKEKQASRHFLIFHLTNMIVIVLASLITKNLILSTLISLVVDLIYVVVLFIERFKHFKFDFSFLKNFKYSSNEIATSFLMFCIYFFSFHIVFSFSEVYVVALNIVSLGTDAFWDSYPIEKIAKVDLSKECFNMKQHLKNSFIYTIIICIISTLLFLSIYKIFDADLKIGLIYLSFQIADFILFSFLSIITVYSQLKFSATFTTASEIISYVIRTILSIVIISPFCADIAQVANSLISITLILPFYIINIKKVKQKNNIN